MERHKQYIVEWGSVNDNVIAASKYVAKMIWDDSSEGRNRYFSQNVDHVYLEGEFKCDLTQFGFNLERPINITYTIYFTKTIGDYNSLFYNNGGDESSNSYSDFEENRINIVTGIIDGHISQEFFSNVMHEVEHIFEYSNGMQKNKNLYQSMRDGLKSDDDSVQWCSRLMYFCFKHERDAFVHEFYGKLLQNNFVGSFEEALNTFDEYLNAVSCRDMVIRVLPKTDVIRACQMLSISFEHLKKYSGFAINKLKRKLFNAYIKYIRTRVKNPIAAFETKMRNSSLVLSETKKIYNDLIIKEEKYIDRV